MESPPPLPGLGRTFYILLLAPLGSMGVVALCALGGGRNSELQGFGMLLSMVTLLAMFVCSILCAVIIGKRRSGGLGVLAFFGIQVVYIAAAFGGCAVVMEGVSFH